MSYKIFAKEVNPSYTESPFWADYDERDCGTSYDGLTILRCESRGVYSYDWTRVKHTDLYDRVLDNAEEAYEAVVAFADRADDSYWCRNYKNLTECLTVMLQPVRKFSTRDVSYLKKVFMNLEDEDISDFEDRHDEIAKVMTILSGEKYATASLIGYCQGDIVHCIYPVAEWSKDRLDALETEYWNGGKGYRITTEDDDEGFCVYFTQNSDDEIRKEIASECGCEPEEVEVNTYF